jgi:hypothetical protein
MLTMMGSSEPPPGASKHFKETWSITIITSEQVVEPMMTPKLDRLVPKLIPLTVTKTPPIVGALQGETDTTVGESYENAFKKIALELLPIVTETSMTIPWPAGDRNLTEVVDMKFVEIACEFPMLQLTGVPNSFPNTKTSVFPEVGPFNGEIEDIDGTS